MRALDWQLEWIPEQSQAKLLLSVQGVCITEHQDFFDHDRVKSALVVDPVPLAEWFIANWWRLRFEGEESRAPGIDWRMSHCLAGAGQGSTWPTLCFGSDGEAIHCQARPTEGHTAPLRFLNALDSWIPAQAFEQAVDDLLDYILQGQPADHPVKELWQQLQEERLSKEISLWRQLEARMGYDPDTAPEALLTRLLQWRTAMGKQAVEEIAAEPSEDPVGEFEQIQAALENSSHCMRNFDRDWVDAGNTAHSPGHEPPWKKAARVAMHVRKQLGIGVEPLSNDRLTDYLSVARDILTQQFPSTPWAAGLRAERGVKIHLAATRETGRRFSLARLLGDHLHTSIRENLLPLTQAKTGRQKFQRAFAQQLLCPFEGLVAWLNTERPNEEQMESAADHFNVSSMVVQHAFENKAFGMEFSNQHRVL
ncbi:MAG: hypothetical protein U5L00_21330 [Desulfovermiculus sp.]|nr:hypothetical protein [Desulfovermiculus sp.]